MRNELLKGKLSYPGSVIFDVYPDREDEIRSFWKVIWFNFLNDNETNGLHWYEKLGAKLYNDLVRRLSHNKWIVSNSLPGRKWASVELLTDNLLEYVTADEIEDIKAKYKYSKYLLGFDDSLHSQVVKQNGEIKFTGLERKGFMEAGNTQFGYDMLALGKYEDAVKRNLTKSMDKVRHLYPEMKTSRSSYDSVSTGIYDWHNENQLEVFTTGSNVSDSRGRAISKALSKVANPLGNKDFRAALVITY